MNPTCASCGQAITKGRNQKVTIVGTEAFHQTCVAAGGVYNSRSNRLARAHKEEQELRLHAARVHDRDLEELRQSMQRQIDRERKIANDAIARRNELVVLADQHNTLIGDLRAELDNVRRQLAEARQQGEVMKMALTPPPPPQKHEPADESAVRFSLLELDR